MSTIAAFSIWADALQRGDHAEGGIAHCYLFGAPVRPCPPSADGERDLFVLGAYPSAFHIKWRHPDGTTLIRAVAVDNEPTPFWTGADERERCGEWTAERSMPPDWGSFEACEENGSSGKKLDGMLFGPLNLSRSRAWITDCLDDYHQSTSARAAMSRAPVAKICSDFSIIKPVHRSHPNEDGIVTRARQQHHRRLLGELAVARPQIVVTLGNAALRVFRELAQVQVAPTRLSADAIHYGKRYCLRLGGRSVEWLPLAHPAAPAPYQRAHQAWLKTRPNGFVS